MGVAIMTNRFKLRELTLDDVTARYLDWFGDPETLKHIPAARSTTSLATLREYVGARVGRPDILFLGIFDGSTGQHIGNIKYEPVDESQGYAVMGILIGDPAYRGRGVAREVLSATAEWLKRHRHIREIVLGVDSDNLPAIRAYEGLGFTVEATPYIPSPPSDCLTMIWHL